jgi:hypothetical protein
MAQATDITSTTGFFTVTRKGLVFGNPSLAFEQGAQQPVSTGFYAMVPLPHHVAMIENMHPSGVSVKTASGENASTILRKICRNFSKTHEIFVLEFTGTLEHYHIVKIGMMRK